MTASDEFTTEFAALQDENIGPEDVYVLPSSLTFWEYAVPGWGIALPVASALSFMAVAVGPIALLWVIVTIALGFLIWWTYRAYWAWVYRPVEGKSTTGMLEWGQKGPLWLGLSSSKKDGVQLDKFDTNPLEKSILQRWFKCTTLELPDGRRVKNIKDTDLDRLYEIRDFKKGADIRELAQGELKIRLDIARLRQAEINGATLQQGLAVLGDIKSLLAASMTRPTAPVELPDEAAPAHESS